MQAAMLRAALLGCLLAAATAAPAAPPIARAGNATRARRRLSVDYQEVAKLVASDAATGDNFGSVAIDGNTIVVGAYQNDSGGSGSAYVLRTSDVGATYDEVAKLTAADAAARTCSASPWPSTETPSWSEPATTTTRAPCRARPTSPNDRRRRYLRSGGQAGGRRRRGGRPVRRLRGDRRRHHRDWGLQRQLWSWLGLRFRDRRRRHVRPGGQADVAMPRRTTGSAAPWRSTVTPS